METQNQKMETQNQKIFFFIADSKTCQVFLGFEQLSSAIGQEVMPLLRHVKTAWFQADFKVRYIHTLVANISTFELS